MTPNSQFSCSASPKFNSIGIVGLGLLGGSIAIDVRKKHLTNCIVGFSRRISTLRKAKRKGFIDKYFRDFEEGIKEVDFLVITTPISVIREYFYLIKENNPKILVTDVASVKEKVVIDAEKILGRESNFIGSHPIAGSEKRGLDVSQEGLFKNKTVVLTPSEFTKKNSLQKVREFWNCLGGKVVCCSPAEHDYMLAFTSHLPHFVIFSLINILKGKEGDRNFLDYIGSGFKDTTRIGKSDPDLWAEIFFLNKKNILFGLKKFEKSLSQLSEDLKKDDRNSMLVKLRKIQKIRKEIDD